MDTEAQNNAAPANAEEEPKPAEPPEPPPMKIVPALPKQYKLEIPEQDLPENLYDMSEKIDNAHRDLFEKVQAMDEEDAYKDHLMQQIDAQYTEIEKAAAAAAAPQKQNDTDKLARFFTLPTQQSPPPPKVIPFQYTTSKEVMFDNDIMYYSNVKPNFERVDDPVISVSSVPFDVPTFTPKPSIVESRQNPWFAHKNGFKVKIVLICIILLLALILVALIFYFMASYILRKK